MINLPGFLDGMAYQINYYGIPRFALAFEEDERYTVTDGAVRTSLARLDLDSLEITADDSGDQLLTLDLRTPWPSQPCHLELPDWQSPGLCAGLDSDQWTRVTVDIPAAALADEADL